MSTATHPQRSLDHPSGTRAPRWATHHTQRTIVSTGNITVAETVSGSTLDANAKGRPRSITAAATGVANRLQTSATGGSRANTDTATGAVASWAANGTATARASRVSPSNEASRGASATTPSAADDESTKPTLWASNGSTTRAAMIDSADASTGRSRHPRAPAMSSSNAAEVARTTDGSSRVSNANQPSSADRNISRRPERAGVPVQARRLNT